MQSFIDRNASQVFFYEFYKTFQDTFPLSSGHMTYIKCTKCLHNEHDVLCTFNLGRVPTWLTSDSRIKVLYAETVAYKRLDPILKL